jgi:hypothetical protein
MENRQISIDWLIRELDLDNNSYNMRRINQAKEIHKQEIIEAVDKAQMTDFFCNYEGSEDYYNQTYKK